MPATLLTDDERGVARALAGELRRCGRSSILIRMSDRTEQIDEATYRADLASPEQVRELLTLMRARHEPIDGLVHCLPLGTAATWDGLDLDGWRHRLRQETKTLFHLTRELGNHSAMLNRGGPFSLIAATGMGGAFARSSSSGAADFFPGHGGVVGLVKTIAREWPDARVKAVDLDVTEPPSALAQHLIAELRADTDGHVEVGYRGSDRFAVQPDVTPLDRRETPRLAIDSSWVIVITGGARGITAEVAIELATRYRPTLVLVGRAPLPSAEEAADTAGLTSLQAIKAALITRVRQEGSPVGPARIEQAYAALGREREIRRTLAAIEAAGATAHYRQVDVRDAGALRNVVDEAYREFGRIDGVIHGAGVIEDKLIKDKAPESFDRVFDTKVDSAFVLASTLHPDTLRFLVFFSSVAACFGNRGQSDYAAANEVLNKLALYLDRRWPARILSVNWGPWAGAGMVSVELQRELTRRGVALIAPEVGRRKFDEELRYGPKGEVEVIIGALRAVPSTEREPASPPVGPLLIGRRASLSRRDGGTVELIRELHADTEVFLDDHRLDGRPVLPLAMAMELVAEVAAQASPKLQVARLTDFQVLRGVVLGDSGQRIRVVAIPEIPSSGDEVQCRVEIVGGDTPSTVHYRGCVVLARRLPPAPALAVPPLTSPRAFGMTVEDAYRRWLFHGPIWQGIRAIEHTASEGISAELEGSSPRPCLADARDSAWLLDPVLVDSAFQLLVLWAREYLDMTPLPARFRAYQRFAVAPAARTRCEVRVRPTAVGHVLTADFVFATPDGRVLARLEHSEVTCSKALNRLAGTTGPMA